MSTEQTMTMNEANQITAATRLYGFIAEKAQSNRFSVTLNRHFKEAGDDAMIVPMNIRPDDLYYTVSGLRQSQLKGAVIAEEYRHDVLELLAGKSEEVLACGFCDILHIRDQKLYGDIMVGRAVAMLLKAEGVKTLHILGSGALAKSVLMHINETDVTKVVLFNDRVESCLELMNALENHLEGIEVDIERVIEGKMTDLGPADAAFNASIRSNAGELMIDPAPLMIDLAAHNSLFKAAAKERYIGYEAMLPYLTQSVYNLWSEQ